MMVATAAWCCGAEPVDQQVFEIAKRDPAVDRPPRREDDHQRIRSSRRPFRPMGRIFDLRNPIFEARRSGPDCGWALPAVARPAAATGTGGRATIRAGYWRRRDAQKAGRRLIVSEAPDGCGRPDKIITSAISSARPSPSLFGFQSRSFRGRLVAQPCSESQQCLVAWRVRDVDRKPASPAASAAASLIAASAIPSRR